MGTLDNICKESWHEEPLTVIVFGASGDLAKKKTYPALFDLFLDALLPDKTIVCGYARSALSNDEFRANLEPYLLKKESLFLSTVKSEEKSNYKRFPSIQKAVKEFLEMCVYRSGQYGSSSDLAPVSLELHDLHGKPSVENRIFYFALPPNVFISTAASVKVSGMTKKGFNRVIVEKPFGHDTDSAEKMSKDLGDIFSEDHLYRIDHYLGKEMVQAMMTLRFSNSWLEPMWNNQYVNAVQITFKEDIGTEGRGGYFDSSGIIRDIMQNHLMQVLSIVAMEAPYKVKGEEASDLIRDEKVKVLKCIKPWSMDFTVLGQYVSNGQEPGYLDDPTVPKGSNCPTYACCVMEIKNRRWSGVPFIMKAGKALDERCCEVRLQMKVPPGASEMFDYANDSPPLNEVVIRIQPNEAVYIKTNIKHPGLSSDVIQSEVDLTYTKRYPGIKFPDAYTRLMLDVLRGHQQNFVRKDELIQAWKIVTPLLKSIESGKVEPTPYKFGTRGPKEADKLVQSVGYKLHKKYKWVE